MASHHRQQHHVSVPSKGRKPFEKSSLRLDANATTATVAAGGSETRSQQLSPMDDLFGTSSLSLPDVCMNSTMYTISSRTLNTKRSKQQDTSPDVLQILEKNYGVILSGSCKDRVLQATAVSDIDLQVDVDIDEHPHRNPVLAVCRGGAMKLDANVVEDMYRLSKSRRKFTLDEGQELSSSSPYDPALSGDSRRIARWSETELQRGSELMESIGQHAGHIRQTVRLLASLAESLDLVAPNDVGEV